MKISKEGATELQPKYSVAEVAGFFKQAATDEVPDVNKYRDLMVEEHAPLNEGAVEQEK